MSHKLLIIGSGGREHALAWKLSQSPKVKKIYIAPGNAGTSQLGENVAIPATDIEALADFAEKKKISLTVVGQDDPLALGIVDKFKKKNLKIWGPCKEAAQIESSKAFAKNLMQRAGIPTARFQTFGNYDHALKYLESIGAPIVIKASGLALGKGVTVCKTLAEAKKALKEAMVDKAFGDAGNEVVIEEFLEGWEFSVHAFCDGKSFKLLPSAQDHKPVFDGGQGSNTGGMGTIAPVPWVTSDIMADVSRNIVTPILKILKKDASPFVGLLYPGLILTKEGPKVIEFNARFGDPETQSLMRLMKSDLLDVLNASVEGKLDQIDIEWHKGYACCVVLASGGYPGKYEKGLPITGIEQAEKMKDVVVFHAGTKIDRGQLITNGGRVLGVTATGETLKAALDKAYAAADLIKFEGKHYRTDIGASSLASS
ncbi:MAG: phosphoribosylamine--glycine ligase [Patescibacteria group bacterium]|nr:phosphoribosylamine--glycine ligase [Patescibacteria group bacterium]